MAIGYSEQVETLMRVHYGRLSEREKRLYAGMEAVKLGYGGQTYLKKLLGVDYKTISHGKKELRRLASGEMIDSGRQRKVGGGRKKNG
jgi:hypothetical protein